MATPVTNPSQIQVVDRDSLVRNFSENATNVLCQAAIGAGTYSIAGKLLGFAKVTPTVGILSVGAMVAAMALCPSGASQSGIFGEPPSFLGGQCPVQYRVNMQITYLSGSSEYPEQVVYGRIKGFQYVDPPGSQGFGLYLLCGTSSDPDAILYVAVYLGAPETLQSFRIVSVARVDGLPDDCGNLPNTGGQVNQSVVDGDTFYDNSVTDNSENVYVAPVQIAIGPINQVVHLPFSDIRIGSLLPLDFSINIGGARYGFEEDKDRRIVPKKQDPDPEDAGDSSDSLKSIYELLKTALRDIKECVCKPDVDLDLLYVPFVDSSIDCQIESASLLVPKGSVSGSLVTKLNASAELAAQKCLEEAPVQLPESLIYSASTTADGRELFSPEMESQVVSLRLSITSVREDGPPKITLYPDANQRKFGSVSFVLSDIKGGGDYIYIFDQETYIPLPTRAKKGRLRLLLKGGLSFNLYDTGERL